MKASRRVAVLAVAVASLAVACGHAQAQSFPSRTITFYFLTAAATPKANIAALNREIVKAIEMPDVRERLIAAGVEPRSSSSEELDTLLKSEVARWGRIIRDSGVRLD